MLANTLIHAAAVSVMLAANGATAVPAIPEIQLDFYPESDATCSSSSLSSVLLVKMNQCYRLANPAKSFHVGGPTTEQQVPEGCIVYGYADTACGESVNLEIAGLSNETLCYTVGTFMGQQNPAQSVVIRC